MESREGREPENQAERLQQKRVQPRLPVGSWQHTMAWGMAMPEVLLIPGREKGCPGQVMQRALIKIRT